MVGDLHQVLYEVEWQKIRTGLLAENNDYGGFGTPHGVRKNIEILTRYIQNKSSDDTELLRRLWRVLNLLNAVLLGYGSREAGTSKEQLVVEARDVYSADYEALKSVTTMKPIDTTKVLTDLETLWQQERSVFRRIQKDLAKRVKTANKKESQGTGGMAYRPHLQAFLAMMEDVSGGC